MGSMKQRLHKVETRSGATQDAIEVVYVDTDGKIVGEAFTREIKPNGPEEACQHP